MWLADKGLRHVPVSYTSVSVGNAVVLIWWVNKVLVTRERMACADLRRMLPCCNLPVPAAIALRCLAGALPGRADDRVRGPAERGGQAHPVWVPAPHPAALHQGRPGARVARLCGELVPARADAAGARPCPLPIRVLERWHVLCLCAPSMQQLCALSPTRRAWGSLFMQRREPASQQSVYIALLAGQTCASFIYVSK